MIQSKNWIINNFEEIGGGNYTYVSQSNRMFFHKSMLKMCDKIVTIEEVCQFSSGKYTKFYFLKGDNHSWFEDMFTTTRQSIISILNGNYEETKCLN